MVEAQPSFLSFRLQDSFIADYTRKKVHWGFDIGGGNSLSELTFIAKYSRKKDDGSKERWHEVCRRCIEGMYSILKDHAKYQRTPWNEFKAQKAAEDAYDRMFHFKWTPPGRGMWAMGTEYVHTNRSNAALINCAFISTEKISTHSAYEATMPFVRLMEMSMNGIGVGYDTKGQGKLTIWEPLEDSKTKFTIPDTREGWAESVAIILESFFFKNRQAVEFDYSEIRPAGAPLKTFGGTASGPDTLMWFHESVVKQFAGRHGEKITSRDIVDLMNKIGKVVVSGGARRSALISLGDASDDDFVNIKNWEYPENAERTGPDGWAWTSNNSVLVNAGDPLDHLIDKIAINGEPGIVWLDMMRNYGRMIDPPDYKDDKVLGVNPCSEISLESHEKCCLVELYPTRHVDMEDFKRTIKHAYLYAKAVVLLPSTWAETNEVITRNRRIGVSMTGIAEFVETRGWSLLQEWMDDGYKYLESVDEKYSKWLGIRNSIRISTVKPAGTTSLIAGTTSGVHWPTTSGYYIRRVRFHKSDPLIPLLLEAGYDVEDDVNDPKSTVVASFPTKGLDVRSEREVSIWEKAHLAAMAQKYWADNMVSVTVSFTEDERKEIAPLLRSLQGQLKSVSFLPISDSGTTYAQAPYEPLDADLAIAMMKDIKPLKVRQLYADGLEAEGEKYCANDTCEIP